MYARFARTFEQFGDLTGQSVLDIGCGSGVYVVEALRRGAATVVALDPAPGMLALVRERLRENDWAARCTLVEGAFPGPALEPADHAIVMGVMDYVADPAAFLCGLRPLVRRSAAISFPSTHFLRTPLRKWRYWLRNCPVYFYEEAQIRRLCQEAGFEETERLQDSRRGNGLLRAPKTGSESGGKMMVHCFTVNVEGFCESMAESLALPQESAYAAEEKAEIAGNTAEILDFLAERGVKGTFFILGRIAEEMPDVVKRIAAAGHEIGSHSLRHVRLWNLSREQAQEAISRSKKSLEDAAGAAVVGFRRRISPSAPSRRFSSSSYATPAIATIPRFTRFADTTCTARRTRRGGFTACPTGWLSAP